MSDILSSLQQASGVIVLLLIVLVIVLLIAVVNLSLGLNRLNRKYKSFMKGKDAQSLERAFTQKFNELERLIEANDINNLELRKIKKCLSKTLNKYGIVKYDAFEDMGGKLSFTLAMLNDDNSGFVLNAIHSRENCFLYIKEIVKGESYIMLSNEEVEALKQAFNYGLVEDIEI